jgi:hypothetical protein
VAPSTRSTGRCTAASPGSWRPRCAGTAGSTGAGAGQRLLAAAAAPHPERSPRLAAVGVPLRAHGAFDRQLARLTTKSWTTIKEKHRAGKLIDKGYLYKLFKNPVFIGVAAYKGKHFPGEHEPILDRALWEQVQEMLGRNDADKRARQIRPSQAPSLLKGLIYADDGWAMTPSFTVKNGKHYRYYVNTASMKIGKDACTIARVPASEIEAVVVGQVRRILQTPEIMAQAIREVQALDPEADAQKAIQTLQSIEPVWGELFPAEQARIVQFLVDRVTVSPSGIRVDMKSAGMRELIQSVIAEPDLKKAA